MFKKILLIILGIILFSGIFIFLVSAVDNETVICNNTISFKAFNITFNSFKLTWNNTNSSINVYKNGVLYLSDYVFNQLTLSQLKSDSLYSVMIINGTCAYTIDVSTKLSDTQNIWSSIDYFKYLFIGWICIFLAIALQRSWIIAIFGELIGFVGFIYAVSSEIDIGYWGKIIYLFGLAGLTFFTMVILQSTRR